MFLGTINMGERRSSKGSSYPSQLGHFKIVPASAGGFAKEVEKKFAELYGEQPTSFKAEVFSIQKRYQRWSARGLICSSSDGIKGRRRIEKEEGAEFVEVKCSECQERDKCKEQVSLQLIIPELPGVGWWVLRSSQRSFIQSCEYLNSIKMKYKLNTIPVEISLRRTTRGYRLSVIVPLTLKELREWQGTELPDVELPQEVEEGKEEGDIDIEDYLSQSEKELFEK